MVVVAAGLLGSCTWIDRVLGRTTEILADLDIQDAVALFVSLAQEAAASVNELYKLTGGGQILRVIATGESGDNLTEQLNPTGVFNLTDSYVIVTYETLPNREVPAVLVRRSDGAVFSLDSVGAPILAPPLGAGEGSFLSLAVPKTDSNGLVYFMAQITEGQSAVVGLDVSNPFSLTAARMTPETDAVIGFTVTPEGHVAYVYGDGGSNRVRKSDGSIHNLPDGTYMALWVGIDGKIHFQDSTGADANEIFTVSIDGAGTVSTDSVIGTGLTNAWISSLNSYLVQFTDRVLLIDTLNGYVAEVENPGNSPRGVTIAEIDTIDIAGASTAHYFLAGTDASNNPLLLKVDPLTDGVTTLLPDGGVSFDIISMVVAPDETVTFNALRLSDGIKIIGSVASDGTLTILDEALNAEVISLERLQ